MALAPTRPSATSEMSTAVTRRPCAAASSAVPEAPQARSATGPSGRSAASDPKTRTASGCGVNDGVKPAVYLAFHLTRLGGRPARARRLRYPGT